MARYIDADELYVNIKAECNPYGKPTINFDDGCKVLDMIRRAPTEDVAPVVHAHWEHKLVPRLGYPVPICSHCGESRRETSDFCPDCGARMDEEVEP